MKKFIFKKTDKFNTISISFRFMAKLDRQTVTKRSLLPFILRSGSKKYRNDFSLNKKLHELYGCSLQTGVVKQASNSVVAFNVKFVDPKLLNDDNYTIKTILDFLKDIIYNPCLYKGSFRKKIVTREKETLEDEILQQIENKASYAINQTFKHLLSSINIEGYLEDLEEINESNLYDTYLDMINNDDLLITVCGNLSDDELELFDNYNDNLSLDPYIRVKNTALDSIVEYSDLNQSQLCIVYDNSIYRNSSEYVTMLVLNTILGASSNSLLFTNIREKHSLCYSIRSDYNAYASTLLIYMGIKHEDYDKCVKLVDEQIDILINKDYDDELLTNTKDILYNQYLGIEDSPNTLLNVLINKELYNIDFNLDELFKEIKLVDKESISNASKKLKKFITYFLTKKVENE